MNKSIPTSRIRDNLLGSNCRAIKHNKKKKKKTLNPEIYLNNWFAIYENCFGESRVEAVTACRAKGKTIRVIKSVNNPFGNIEGGWRWWGYGGEETMRGHHLWRNVSEINKLRESAARKEKRLAVGVESEAAGTNDCNPRTRWWITTPSSRGWLALRRFCTT